MHVPFMAMQNGMFDAHLRRRKLPQAAALGAANVQGTFDLNRRIYGISRIYFYE